MSRTKAIRRNTWNSRDQSRSVDRSNWANNTLGLLGLVPAVLFVLSVLYDWVFLYALDLSFREIPTTLTDHFRSGLLWLPELAIFSFIGIAMEMQTRRMELGQTEQEIIQGSRNPERTAKFRSSWIKPIFATLALYVVLFLSFGTAVPVDGIRFAAPAAWFVFTAWYFSVPRIFTDTRGWTRVSILVIPAICMYSLATGFSDSTNTLVERAPETNLKLTSTPISETAVLVRNFETGLLVATFGTEEVTFKFVTWQEIRSFEVSSEASPFDGLLGPLVSGDLNQIRRTHSDH